MVVFNCNACGEALKKNQVEKHYQSVCRRCEVLSCVDCGKDFWGDDYKQHIKCISEEEKYSGKNYKPKANANKGEVKQEQWFEKVQEAIDNANPSPRLKEVLEKLKDYPNVPRKKAKFENFLSNSLRVRDKGVSSKVWDLLMTNVEKQEDGPSTSTNFSNGKTNDETGQNAENGTDSQTKIDNDSNVTVSHNTETVNGETSSKLNKRERKEERRKKANKMEKKDLIAHSSAENGNADEPKQKKKKKRKHQDIEEEGMENGFNGEKTNDDIQSKKSKRKRKHDGATVEETTPEVSTDQLNDSGVLDVSQSSEVTGNDEPEPSTKKQKIHFDWEAVIFQVLRSKSDKEMSVKKLKKKVICEYLAQGGFVEKEEKLWAKFDRKINKNPNLKVHKDKVKLLE